MSESVSASPYAGLQPFTEAKRGAFFGREAERRVIAANLLSARLTLVHGASGVGKSSILLAGVVPYVRALPDMLVVTFRNWHDVNFAVTLRSHIIEAATQATGQSVDVDSALPLDEFIARVSQQTNRTVALLLDQYEDFLRASATHLFDGELLRTVGRDDVNANVLIMLRDDALPRLDRYGEAAATWRAEAVPLEPLKRSEATRAIRKPLEAYNAQHPQAQVTLEDALVDALLNATRKHAADESGSLDHGIEASYLQLFLVRLWHAAISGDHALSVAAWRRLGGAQAIVGDYLDDVMTEFDADAQGVCARFFPHLATPSGTKLAQTLEDISAYAERPATQIEPLLETLDGVRVLRALAPRESGARLFLLRLLVRVCDFRRRHRSILGAQPCARISQLVRQQLAEERHACSWTGCDRCRLGVHLFAEFERAKSGRAAVDAGLVSEVSAHVR